MNYLQAFIIAIVEGITEYLPVSSTAHIIFTSSFFNIQENDFVKLFSICIQVGAILAVIVLYYKKFFDFRRLNFYYRLIVGVIPALILGALFSENIELVLGNPIPIAIVLIVGGFILLFVDDYFKNQTITHENEISYRNAFIVGIWQCLAMMPGVSRSAASIIGGMQQKMSRKVAAEFSFFLAVPTMFAATAYSIILKTWGEGEYAKKGYELILESTQNLNLFILGNVIAFIVSLIAIKFFISMIQKYGFKPWGWYRIIVGVCLLYFFYN